MKENNNYLASNIKTLRKRKNITQKQIADFCYKSDVAVSYWESGSREPNSVDLGKLSVLFDIPVDDLLFKDLRKENLKDETEVLFSKYKDILTDDDKETIRFLIEKRKKDIDNQEDNK